MTDTEIFLLYLIVIFVVYGFVSYILREGVEKMGYLDIKDGYAEQGIKGNRPSINMVKYDQDNEWYLKTPPTAGYKKRLKP